MKLLNLLLVFVAVAASNFLATTASAQITNFPYTQSFDSLQPPSLPSGWNSTQNRVVGTNDFTTATTTPRSSPNAVGSTNATIAQSLMSPLFDFWGLNPDSIVFHVRRSSTHEARLLVEASLDGGGTYSLQLGDSLRNIVPNSYQQVKFPLPAILASSHSVRFRWRIVADATGTTATLRIDDVIIMARRPDDLELSELSFARLFTEGDTVFATAKIRNVGQQSASNFGVEFFIDANRDSVPQPSELRASVQSGSTLVVGDSTNLTANIGALAASMHQIIGRLVFVPDQQLANNQRVVTLNVGLRWNSIVVNEIMYAPSGSEPEWIELFNSRTDSIDLKNWMISDNAVSSRKTISTQRVLIPPLGFVLLTRDSFALLETYPGMRARIISVSNFPSLNNTGDAAVIYDSRSATMDSVAYSPSWGGGGGVSLERLDVSSISTDSSNWISSADSLKATPGRRNSQMMLDRDLRVVRVLPDSIAPGTPLNVRVVVQNSGKLSSGQFEMALFDDANGDSTVADAELVSRQTISQSLARRESLMVGIRWEQPPSGVRRIIVRLDYSSDERLANNIGFGVVRAGFAARSLVINEIMYSPLSAATEYIELFNSGPLNVDLAQWRIHDRVISGSCNEFELSVSSKRLEAGEYFVLAADSSVMRMFPPIDTRCCSVVSQSSLGLNNDGDEIVLVDPAGNTIDSVAYVPDWHNPNVVDKSGRSLEKINPSLPSNGIRNWTTCAFSIGGTPGHQNSVFTAALPAQSHLSIQPNPFSPDGDGREDFTMIQYEVPLAVSMVRLRVYDAVGRLIRTIANNEASGSRGSIVWDGLDDDKRKARVGAYLVLLEAIDAQGGVIQKVKGVVVVAAQL